MANFDQNVTINLSVDSRGVQSKLTAAATEIKGVKESLEGLDTDFDSATDSLQSFADAGDDDIAPSLDLEGIDEEMEQFSEFADSLEKVAELKDDVAESNEVLSNKNEKTADSTENEAQSFETLMKSASSLSETKDAVANSNAVLDNEARNTREGILLEKLAGDELNETIDDLGGATEILLGKQKKLSQQEKDTAAAADIETRSFEEMMESADSLQGAKHAVANANEKVQNESGKSTRELLRESDAVDETRLNMEKFSGSIDDTSDSSRVMTRAIRKMREGVDDSTDSMRAAAEVGDLFEDGLGSLSLNLGAFTIALRNFLTQVPLLLTGLGALGAAALGAASAFAVLAGAMGSVIAVGALAHAQQLRDQYAGIEELGESLQVIMKNLFDLFLEAIQPLRQLSDVVSFFTEAVDGLATGVSLVSNAFAELIQGSAQLEEFADSVGKDLFTIQDAIDQMDGDSWRELTESLMQSWVLLGDEVVVVLGAINSALAGAVTRSSELLSEVDGLGAAFGQFGSTLSELAELGFTIGSGLLPVFKAFSSIVENVAGALNEMDDAMVANAITFLAVFAASSRVAGTMASLVRIVPSVVTGFRSISAAAAMANTPIRGMKVAMQGVATNVGQFLTKIGAFGGMTELALAAGSTGEAFREIAFSSSAASAHFQSLALQTDFTAEELKELAVQGKLTESQINQLVDETEDLSEESRKAALQLQLTEEQLEDLDESADFNFDFADDGTIDPSQFQKTGNAADAASDSIRAMSRSTAVASKQAEAAVVSNGLLSTVYQNLRISIIKTRIAQYGYLGALKKTIVAVTTAIVQKGLMIAANFGLVSSELAAAGATVLLDAAITSLTGGLNKVIPAIIGLIVLIGALAVGIMKNMDGIKSALNSMWQVLATVIGGTVDILMRVFVAAWDALRQMILPLLRPFISIAMAIDNIGGSAKEGGGILKTMKLIIDALVGSLTFLIRVLGLVGRVIIQMIMVPLEFAAVIIAGVIDLISWLTENIAQFLGLIDEDEGMGSLLAGFNIFFENVLEGFGQLTHTIEDFLNDTVIAGINEVIRELNNVPGFNVAQVQDVKLTRDEVTTTDEADVDAKEDKSITYNEDNSTNVDQTVNADPEDKAAISRVVKDAMEEANSFSRRKNGHTGN